jgi:hypothetical protein
VKQKPNSTRKPIHANGGERKAKDLRKRLPGCHRREVVDYTRSFTGLRYHQENQLEVIMKKYLFLLFATVISFAASSSWAVLIGDVGSLDPLYACANVNSGAQNEADWLNSLLGTSFDSNYVEANKIQPTFEAVTGVGALPNEYAFQLPSNEGYFLVKTGNATYDHWLFQNVDSTFWGTVLVGGSYTTIVGGQTVTFNGRDIDFISHVVPAGAPVPEPATLMLLGVGLIGLAGYGRKKLN